MTLRIFYVSGRKADGTRIDAGPFFTEAEARAWARAEGLSSIVVDEATRRHVLGGEAR